MTMRRLSADEVGTHWARGMVAGFGRWAGPAFVLLLLSGLLLAGAQVATVTALFATAYGVILIVKVGLVGGVGLLGARHARLTGQLGHGGGRWRRLRLSIAAEAAGAALILGLASTLASSPPARGAQFEASADSAPGIATVDVADLIVRVELRPNRPGRNLLAIDVLNTRRPIPGPVRGVTVELRRPGSAPQQIVTAPTLSATSFDGGAVDLASAGELGITVVVERAGLAATVAQVSWQVNTNAPPPHPTVVSSQSLAPIVDTAAVIIGLMTLLFIVPSRRRRSKNVPVLGEKEPAPA
jgi:copper transport protein